MLTAVVSMLSMATVEYLKQKNQFQFSHQLKALTNAYIWIVLLLWCFSIIRFFINVKPGYLTDKASMINVLLIFAILFGTIFNYQTFTNYQHPLLLITSGLSVILFYCCFVLIAIITAKILCLNDLKRKPRFVDLIPYVVGIIAFVIGIWFVQNVVRRLYFDITSRENNNS